MIATAGLRAGVFSQGIRNLPGLESFFDFEDIVWRPAAGQVDVVLTWGNKGSGELARNFAEKHSLPLWRLEDGFFRSVGSGPESPPLSLVLDDQGIYYDAKRPSRLESQLNALDDSGPQSALLQRIERTLSFVKKHRLSKYNDSIPGAVPESKERPRVLLVDQTMGDASVRDGLADEGSFQSMLDWALEEFPDAELVVKTHPEVIQGRKQGYLPLERLRDSRVRVESAHVSPGELLRTVSYVLTVTSQLGFEALCYGKPVTCFGAPFYAGWGLTTDRIPLERRTRTCSLPELLVASWLLYPRYLHPVTRQRCELEDILEHLALQRDMFSRNRERSLAVGFAGWKQPAARAILSGPGATLDFTSAEEAAVRLSQGGVDRVYVWGQKANFLKKECETHNIKLSTVEDGFLRSAALGSDLTPPGSLAVDQLGIYYDSTRPSDLEEFLSNHAFDEKERKRASMLCQLIRESRVSKYNVQRDAPVVTFAGSEQRVLLVVGQVDDDASIALGAGSHASNSSLVRAVRAARPRDYLLYKPHPDVLSGHRRGQLTALDKTFVDQVEDRLSVTACLDAADEVHTNTSLVGFEALLRGIPVHAYGSPFYAGWGLTNDHMPCPRRTRQLKLNELAFAALVAYPRYYSLRVGCFVSAEEMVFELKLQLESQQRDERIQPSFSRGARRVVRALKGRLHGR